MKKITTTSISKTTIIEAIPVTKELIFDLIKTQAHVYALPDWEDCEPVKDFFNELFYAIFPDERPKEAKSEEEQAEQEESNEE